MAEPLKNAYNLDFFKNFSKAISATNRNHNPQKFLKKCTAGDWMNLELKERMYQIADCLYAELSGKYNEKIRSLIEIVKQLEAADYLKDGFEFMLIPEIVSRNGLDHYDVSMKAMERITQFVSCEFAVRPFIQKYKEKAIPQLLEWSNHNHPMVRRLASEGSRPRLPWAMALPSLKKDPSPILPILENLKNDPSETVRRSVANNLNDIAKDNPQITIKLVKKWKGNTLATDKLVKHASRTLLKAGEQEIMKLFGFGSIQNIEISDFKILTPRVNLGEYCEFQFCLSNTAKTDSLIRLEYGIYFLKANGKHARKVFSISEKSYAGNSITQIKRRQPFKLISTRKLYAGTHQVALIINGVEQEKYLFNFLN